MSAMLFTGQALEIFDDFRSVTCHQRLSGYFINSLSAILLLQTRAEPLAADLQTAT